MYIRNQTLRQGSGIRLITKNKNLEPMVVARVPEKKNEL